MKFLKEKKIKNASSSYQREPFLCPCISVCCTSRTVIITVGFDFTVVQGKYPILCSSVTSKKPLLLFLTTWTIVCSCCCHHAGPSYRSVFCTLRFCFLLRLEILTHSDAPLSLHFYKFKGISAEFASRKREPLVLQRSPFSRQELWLCWSLFDS